MASFLDNEGILFLETILILEITKLAAGLALSAMFVAHQRMLHVLLEALLSAGDTMACPL